MRFLLTAVLVTVSSWALAQGNASKTKIKAPAAAPSTTTPAATTTTAALPSEADPMLKNAALSTFNYFPATGSKSVLFTPQFLSATYADELKTTKNSVDVGGLVTGVEYKARINPTMAFFATESFGSQNISGSTQVRATGARAKTSYQASGIGDLHLGLQTMKEKGAGNLYFTADLGLSPGAAEVGSNHTDGNRYSGGTSFTPAIAYEQIYGTRVIGWKGAFSLKDARAIEQAGELGQPRSKRTETGANDLSATVFTEWQARAHVKMGALAQVEFLTSGSREAEGVNDSIDPYQLLSLGLYGEGAVGKSTTLIPRVGLTNLLNLGGSSVNTYQQFTLGLAARVAL